MTTAAIPDAENCQSIIAHQNEIMRIIAARLTAGGLHAETADHGTGIAEVTVTKPGMPGADRVSLLYEGILTFERTLSGHADQYGHELIDTCNRLLTDLTAEPRPLT
jgi:hypothetical protein